MPDQRFAESAQWSNYPIPGLPRTPGGKPDLNAPAPRSADGKPDLTGVWRVKQQGYLLYVTSNLKPEEMRPWAANLLRQHTDNFHKNTDMITCLPPGPKAGISGVGLPMKIVQTPNLVVILYEYQTLYRQIFTDGRGLPEDPNPTWMGYSIGRWDGDTLVVTTAGYNDRTTLDVIGHPHSEALHVTERFRRRDAGHIDLQVTLDDSKAYTRAWTLPIELELVPDGELIEYVCENERDAPHMIGTAAETFPVPVEMLAQYAGVYESRGFPAGVVVSLEGERLMIDLGGVGKTRLIANSENSFNMDGMIVDFVRDAKGAVTGMITHRAEGDGYWPRRK